jgi:phage baseplate assembly protein W
MATVQNIQKLYSDIDFTLSKRPVLNDIALSYDNQAIIRSVRNILLTKKFEKLWNPEFGSNIDILLFENISSVTASALEKEISVAISNYEPRVNMKSVLVTPYIDRNAYDVTLTFYIANATQPTTVTVFLERNR